MALRRRRYEARNLLVGHGNLVFKLLGKRSESAAEHDRDARVLGHARTNGTRRILSAGIKIRCCRSLSHSCVSCPSRSCFLLVPPAPASCSYSFLLLVSNPECPRRPR